MMAENIQQQQKTSARELSKEQAIQETTALCRHCGAALDSEFPFCPSCGEKTGGGEQTCEFCQTKTSKEICPHCGRRVIPVPCSQCGTPALYDACENCGAIMNPVLNKALAQEAPIEIAKMSGEEAQKIETDFKSLELNESAEFKAFQKKLVERQILLEERDYFNKREKRIIKAFGSRPFTLELPDPAEEAFRMKAYAALEKTAIEREEKEIEAELEKLFPPVADISIEDAQLVEKERNRAEMEQKFNEALSKVNNEVDAFREAERKRKEEEARREAERQRQMEIERRRLEEERRKNRVNGIFYYYNNDFEMTLQIAGMSKGQAYYNCFVCGGHAYLDFNVNCSGDDVYLRCKCLSDNTCGFSSSGHNDDRLNFTGSLNNAGTLLTGYWGNGSGSFRSQYFGGDQSSASSGTFYKR
jgi:RNA polymerase subunit RPABC4/transcription elongation factor Spt4